MGIRSRKDISAGEERSQGTRTVCGLGCGWHPWCAGWLWYTFLSLSVRVFGCVWFCLGFVREAQLLTSGKIPVQSRGSPARDVADTRTWQVSFPFLQQMLAGPLTWARCGPGAETPPGNRRPKDSPALKFVLCGDRLPLPAGGTSLVPLSTSPALWSEQPRSHDAPLRFSLGFSTYCF